MQRVLLFDVCHGINIARVVQSDHNGLAFLQEPTSTARLQIRNVLD
jgi:hypothetical protein